MANRSVKKCSTSVIIQNRKSELPWGWPSSESQQTINARESVGQKGTSPCREQYVDSLKTKNRITIWSWRGFPDSSAGKVFACNAGDPGSIPGLGRSPGEGIGYLLQYSWTSLLAQMIRDPPVGFWVQSLGWKLPCRRASQPTQYFCWENPHTQRSLVGYRPRGRKELDTTEQPSTNDAIIPLLGTRLEITIIRKNTCASMLLASLFCNRQDMEAI